MYKLCKTEQSAQRQRQIEEALLIAMQTRRYDDISISDLCEGLNVPRKSFYRYFSGKDGALHALLDHRLMEYEMRRVAAPNSSGDVLLDLPQFFAFWLSQKNLLDALARSGLSGMLVQRAVSHSLEQPFFPELEKPRSKAYLEVATGFLVCGLMSTVIQWHHDGYRQTPREMAEAMHDLLTKPLLSGQDLN